MGNHLPHQHKHDSKRDAHSDSNFLGHQGLSKTKQYLHVLDVDRGGAAILEDHPIAVKNIIEPPDSAGTKIGCHAIKHSSLNYLLMAERVGFEPT